MAEPKTQCTTCGGQILQRTADRNEGLCAVCLHEANMARRIKPKGHVLVDTRTNKIVPPDPVELDVEIDLASLLHSGSVDWRRVEDALLLMTSEYVRAFATFHRDKTFYGFAFDCNADYAQVFVCANTPAALTASARYSKYESPDLYDQESIEDIENGRRWSLGDWAFHSLNTDGFSEAWTPVGEILADAIPWDDDDDDDQALQQYRDAFMNTACRSMIRLESAGVLDGLNRTEDFKAFVADHDETDEDSWSRLARVRQPRSGDSQ